MTWATELKQLAIMEANTHADRLISLKKDLEKLEADAQLTRVQIALLEPRYERAKAYVPVVDDVPQCPRCAIASRAEQVAMKPIPNANDADDHELFRCRCGFEVGLSS